MKHTSNDWSPQCLTVIAVPQANVAEQLKRGKIIDASRTNSYHLKLRGYLTEYYENYKQCAEMIAD